MDSSAFMRDSHQKCAVARGLEGAKDDDIVIFSDVDEIPNPEAVKRFWRILTAEKSMLWRSGIFTVI